MEIARHYPRSLAEIPFASSTLLDPALAVSRSQASLQKYRQLLRRKLGRGPKLSLGRRGTIQLDSVVFLPCLQTASRWSSPQMETLVTAFRDEGLGQLAGSEDYSRTVDLTLAAVRARLAEASGRANRLQGSSAAGSAPMLAELLAEVTTQLVESEPAVCRVAAELGEIGERVAARVPGFRRVAGRVVRFEDPIALVALEEKGEERLEEVDGSYLRSMGLEHEGDPFVLQELRWTPDTTARLFIPAVELAQPVDYDSLSARVEEARTPLPRPASSPGS